nr:uncharacterized mitochondrial protein AtMg00810-like [Tanacetum cinerariifolium]
AGNQTDKNVGPQNNNGNADTQDNVDAEKEVTDQNHIMLPLWSSISYTHKSLDDKAEDDKPKDDTADSLSKEFEQGCMDQRGAAKAGSTNSFNTVSTPVNAAKDTVELRSTGIFTSAYDDDLDTFTSLVQNVGPEADFNNMESSTVVSHIPTHRVHIDHPKDQIMRDPQSVQTRGMVYVDDIIFGSTKKSLCDEFEALMHKRFQMNSIGELTFFLGLQVKQNEEGIFISQDKYVVEILKKFDFSSVRIASTPIETQKQLVKDEEAANVDVHLYRSTIESLLYLTASRPDIIDSLFDLEAYSDSDYAGANLDRKSTTGEYVAVANYCG